MMSEDKKDLTKIAITGDEFFQMLQGGDVPEGIRDALPELDTEKLRKTIVEKGQKFLDKKYSELFDHSLKMFEGKLDLCIEDTIDTYERVFDNSPMQPLNRAMVAKMVAWSITLLESIGFNEQDIQDALTQSVQAYYQDDDQDENNDNDKKGDNHCNEREATYTEDVH